MRLIRLKDWDRTTSFLHFGLALGVTLQLFVTRFLRHVVPHAFLYHEILGLTIVALVLLHWYIAYLHPGLLRHLLPWHRNDWHAIEQDVQGLAHLKLPPGGQRPGLAGLVHGLGLLAVTAMAFSGLFIFIGIIGGGAYLPMHWFKATHSFIATFVWIYWFGHVAAALSHAIFDRR